MKKPCEARSPKHLERILRESVSRDGFGSAVTRSRDCPGAVGRGCAGDALSLTASLASGGGHGRPGAGTADGADPKGVGTARRVMGAPGEAGKPGTMGSSCSARQQMARGKAGHGTWCCCWVCSGGRWRDGSCDPCAAHPRRHSPTGCTGIPAKSWKPGSREGSKREQGPCSITAEGAVSSAGLCCLPRVSSPDFRS